MPVLWLRSYMDAAEYATYCIACPSEREVDPNPLVPTLAVIPFVSHIFVTHTFKYSIWILPLQD